MLGSTLGSGFGACALALLAQSAPPDAATDRRVNEFAVSAQDHVALDAASDGRIVVAWDSRRQNHGYSGVCARVLDRDGVPLGAEIELHGAMRSAQTRPAVACARDGAAWFAWESFGADGDRGAIVARRMELEGARLSELQVVNRSTEGAQGEVALAAGSEDRALVVWTGPGSSGLARGVFARVVAAQAERVGPQLRVDDAHIAARNGLPCVARCGDEFLVVWARTDANGRPAAIVGRFVGSGGELASGEFELSAGIAGAHIEPALASDGANGALAGWLTARGDVYDITLRRIDRRAEGKPELGAACTLVTEAPYTTSGLAIALAASGRGLVAWNRSTRGTDDVDAMRVIVDARGRVVGAPVRATGSASGVQRIAIASGSRRALLLDEHRFALAWSGDGGQGDASGAHVSLGGIDREPAVAPIVRGEDAASAQPQGEAAPHDPPAFNPGSIPAGPPVNLSAAGVDYGFLALTDNGWVPPDPQLAAGPLHLVAVANGSVAFFQKNGQLDFTSSLEGPAGFFGSVGAQYFVFDPEVVYDPRVQRFFVLAAERDLGHPYFLLAVSDDADPNGPWHRYRFDVWSVAQDTDIDSTNIGIDDQAVYLSADFFNPDKHLVHIVEKAAVVAGATPIERDLVLAGDTGLGVPPLCAGSQAQLLLQAFDFPQSSNVAFHAITDPLGAPQVQQFVLGVPQYTRPENPPQLGTSVQPETFDARFWSCSYSAGYLWATHHVGATRVLQRWYQFALNGWPASGTPGLVQWGEIDLGADVRTCYGAIAADAQQNAALVYARSSPSEFFSIVRAVRAANDAPGTFRAPETIQSSLAPDITGRWGDYGAVTPDPTLGGAFWTHHEFREVGWNTWIALVGVAPTPATYCTAKVTSLGTSPTIGWSGEASLGVDDCHATLTNAVPNAFAIPIRSPLAIAKAFQGGTLCVKPPLLRGDVLALDAQGSGDQRIPLSFADFGRTVHVQFWFRDGMHPDGTGAGLSDALAITVGP